MNSNGPTFTKATYDHKRPRYDPPSPERQRIAEQELANDCARERALDHELKAHPSTFIQRIIARTKKPPDEE